MRRGAIRLRRAAALLLIAAAVAACADGAGNALSTGAGGTLRAYYGRASQ